MILAGIPYLGMFPAIKIPDSRLKGFSLCIDDDKPDEDAVDHHGKFSLLKIAEDCMKHQRQIQNVEHLQFICPNFNFGYSTREQIKSSTDMNECVANKTRKWMS